ncbi:hypothetical protein ENUP19_0181G0006 [Entamoeba nuttalli]|uniref:Chorein N-terminal domain-containing protein n=1 Tax=Entamoeba nuttalli TaxID=412467 RepID=A0ABQ0DN01_9EUKA
MITEGISLSAVLKKIRIRKDAFYSLNLPISIIQGEVETIKVIVQSLTFFRLSIFIEGVTVKCEPQKEFVNEEENESIESIKKRLLKEYEDKNELEVLKDIENIISKKYNEL